MANGLFYEIGLFKNVSESCLQTDVGGRSWPRVFQCGPDRERAVLAGEGLRPDFQSLPTQKNSDLDASASCCIRRNRLFLTRCTLFFRRIRAGLASSIDLI